MKPNVLIFTCTHGSRRYLRGLVSEVRATAGTPFHWLVVLSAPDPTLRSEAEDLLASGKIDYLHVFDENRGQHWATRHALSVAEGYKWLLRLDDDITIKTRLFLQKMIERLEWLRSTAGDERHRLVCAPKVTGLQNPLQPAGFINLKGQDFPCEVMELLGGACRLHPTELLGEYRPDIYAPIGRSDPQQLTDHVIRKDGALVRFPDIRVQHRTADLESHDSPEMARLRRMSKCWCWLGEDC